MVLFAPLRVPWRTGRFSARPFSDQKGVIWASQRALAYRLATSQMVTGPGSLILGLALRIRRSLADNLCRTSYPKIRRPECATDPPAGAARTAPRSTRSPAPARPQTQFRRPPPPAVQLPRPRRHRLPTESSPTTASPEAGCTPQHAQSAPFAPAFSCIHARSGTSSGFGEEYPCQPEGAAPSNCCLIGSIRPITWSTVISSRGRSHL